MEVIFLDRGYNMTKNVDAFSSLIWNENYIGYGDFELRFPMEDTALAGIREGWYASIKESNRYMIVEGIETSTSIENGNYAVVTGRSLESILDRRVLLEDIILLCDLQEAIMRVLNASFISPEQENRSTPFFGFRKVTNKAITSIEVDLEYKAGSNVYDIIYDICSAYHVGFRVLPENNGGFVFELYTGIDRSYSQEKNPWIVFSSKFENIQETDMIMDTSGLKNVAVAINTYTDKWTDENDEEQSEEKSFVIEVGETEKNGIDRREILLKYSETPEIVDRAQFGKATDRVNRMDYCTWELLHFDSKGYYGDLDAYYSKVASRAPTKPPESTTTWVAYKPGDPGYIEPGTHGISVGDPAGINGYWKTEKTPQADLDKWKADNKAYYDAAANSEPNKRDYETWGWLLTDVSGYNAAVAKAQQEINTEYEAARTKELDIVKDVVKNDAMIQLQPYLIISEFEGEVDSKVQSQYGVDYYLGDVVQIVNEYNFQATTRVVGMTYSEEEGVGFVARPLFKSDDKTVFEL